MRKLFLLGLVLCTTTYAAAQSNIKKHAISVSYGVASIVNLANQFSDVMLSGLSDQYISFGNQAYSGAINAEYVYRLNRTIGIGAALGYERAKRDILSQKRRVGSMTDHYITVMPVFKCNWLHGGIVRLYSKATAGASFNLSDQWDDQTHDTAHDKRLMVAFQVSPLGIECGRALCGTLELGYGYQGMVQLGVKYRF